MITRNVSNMMKAFAIMMVICGHILNNYLHNQSSLPLVLGTGGVAVFLILSGYGLAVSYQRNGIQNEYWEHKIRKVLIPYWIVTCLWAAFLGLFRASRSELIIKNILLVDYNRGIDATMWYLSMLLLWYILFFFIFKYNFSDIFKILLLAAFAWFFYDNPSNLFGECAWQFSRNAFSFPTGVLLGTLSWKKREKKWNRSFFVGARWFLLLVSFAGILIFYRLKTNDRLPVQVMGFCVFVFLLCICLFAEHSSVIVRVLTAVSSISYVLYLVEGKWFSLVSRMKIQNDYLNAGVYILSIAAFSLLYTALKRFFASRKKTPEKEEG